MANLPQPSRRTRPARPGGARTNTRRTVERAAAPVSAAPGSPPRRIRTPRSPWLGATLRALAGTALAGALVAGLVVGVERGFEYATSSPRFEVRSLVYAPTPHVSDQRLRELLGIARDTNILALDLDALAHAVAAEPWVARATVSRELPDTLVVEVVEHEPVAVLLAGGFFLTDADGVPFKRLDPSERGDLPVVTGIDRGLLLTQPKAASQRMGRALETIRRWGEKKRPRLGEVNVGEGLEITAYAAERGTQFRLGRGSLELALNRLDAVRAALGDEADDLAVLQLDAAPPRGGAGDSVETDRVVVRWFEAAPAATLLAAAPARAADPSDPLADSAAPRAAARRDWRHHGQRIPRDDSWRDDSWSNHDATR